jgi:NADPH:quinone reductase-like Zn-dependent oxidoreductase
MRAAIFRRTGAADVLEIAELPTPVASAGEVLVRVRIAALQPFDVRVRSGGLPLAPGNDFPIITGNEFAGEIVQLGADVEGFAVGDRVAGRHTFGCAAEYLAVPASDIARLPGNVEFAGGAYLGGTGQTADTAVEFLKIGPGDVFLIHGGAGGVGSIALQLGRLAGATVLATGSAANQDYLAGLGAIPLVYGAGLRQRIEAAAPSGVTAILDCVGGEALDLSVELLADRQRIATLGDHRRAASLGVQWPTGVRNGVRLARLLKLASEGRLTPTIRRVFPLADIVAAHRAVEAGHGIGKIMVAIG